MAGTPAGAPAAAAPAKAASATPSITKDVFRVKVLAEQTRFAIDRMKRTYTASTPETELLEVEGGHKVIAKACPSAKRLLAAARASLKAEQAAKKAPALAVKRIGIVSAYRPASADQPTWNRVFERHYNATLRRRRATGDPHGARAVTILVDLMKDEKAVPGFSNHQRGLAIDFGTKEGTDAHLRYVSSRSWFAGWLEAHAGAHSFRQLPKERWHYDFVG